MTRNPSLHRWMLAALLVAAGAVSFAPLAQARGWWNHRHRVDRAPMRVELRERDHLGGAPLLAGLIGGVILGAAISTHEQPVVVRDRYWAPPPPPPPPPPAARYRYEDGRGDRWWDTLDEATDAAWSEHGPRVIQVVDARTDAVVRTLYWKHDHWISDRDREDGDD